MRPFATRWRAWSGPAGWYKGVAGGTVTEYSDNLLMFKLKQLKPEYRDRLDIRAGSIDVSRVDIAKLPHHMIDRIANGELIEAVLASGVEATMKSLKQGPIQDGECEEIGHGDL